jgi:hypothetical protein
MTRRRDVHGDMGGHYAVTAPRQAVRPVTTSGVSASRRRSCAGIAAALRWHRGITAPRESRSTEAGANPARPRHCNGQSTSLSIATG